MGLKTIILIGVALTLFSVWFFFFIYSPTEVDIECQKIGCDWGVANKTRGLLCYKFQETCIEGTNICQWESQPCKQIQWKAKE